MRPPRAAQALIDAEAPRLIFIGGGGSLIGHDGGRFVDSPHFPAQYLETALDQAGTLERLRKDGAPVEWSYLSPTIGVRQAALAGNSWSGWALAFAQRNPDRVSKLVLLDATGLDQPGTLMWEALKIPILGEVATKLSTTKSTVRSLAEDMMVNKNRITADLLDEWWAPMTYPDNIRATYLLERRLDWAQTERALPATQTPILLLWGKQDTIQPVERAHRFAELLPHDQLHILDGCGHAPQLDCPDVVTGYLESFFSQPAAA